MDEQTLLLRIMGDPSQAIASMGEMSGAVKTGIAGMAASLAALGLAKLGNDAIAIAEKTKLSVAQMENATDNALKGSGQSYSQWKDEINAALAAESSLSSYSKGDLRQAFTGLIGTTKDVKTALSLVNQAADLKAFADAKGKSISLSQAATLLGKVYMGNTTALTRFGIVVDKNATGMQALHEIQLKTAGSAKILGDSEVGLNNKVNNAIKGTMKDIGDDLMPMMTELKKGELGVLQGFQELPKPIKQAGTAIVGLSVAAGIATVAIGMVQKAVAGLGITAGAATFGSELAVGFELAAGGASIAEVSTLGFASALGALAYAFPPVIAALVAYETLMHGEFRNNADQTAQAVLGDAFSFDALSQSVSAGVVSYRALNEAVKNGAVNHLSEADKLKLATLAQDEATTSADGLSTALDGVDQASGKAKRGIDGLMHAEDDLSVKERGAADAQVDYKLAVIDSHRELKTMTDTLKKNHVAQSTINEARRAAKGGEESALAFLAKHKKLSDDDKEAILRAARAYQTTKDKAADAKTAVKDFQDQAGKGVSVPGLGTIASQLGAIGDAAYKAYKNIALVASANGGGVPNTSAHGKKSAVGGRITSRTLYELAEDPAYAPYEYVINPLMPNASTLIEQAAADVGYGGKPQVIQHITGSAYDAELIAVSAGLSVRNTLADAAMGG